MVGRSSRCDVAEMVNSERSPCGVDCATHRQAPGEVKSSEHADRRHLVGRQREIGVELAELSYSPGFALRPFAFKGIVTSSLRDHDTEVLVRAGVFRGRADTQPAIAIKHVDARLPRRRSRLAEPATDVRGGDDMVPSCGLGGGGHRGILPAPRTPRWCFPIEDVRVLGSQ